MAQKAWHAVRDKDIDQLAFYAVRMAGRTADCAVNGPLPV